MSFSVYRKIINFILLLMAGNLSAQVTYYDAAEFQLLGKATTATTERYVRLPDSLEHISRLPLWQLSRNSSGMAVRFRSNSTPVPRGKIRNLASSAVWKPKNGSL